MRRVYISGEIIDLVSEVLVLRERGYITKSRIRFDATAAIRMNTFPLTPSNANIDK